MAKKTIKLNTAAPTLEASSAEAKKRDEKYQTEEDVGSVKKFIDLRKNPPRLSKAINYIRSQAADLDSLTAGGRRGSKKMARGISRQGRRRAPRNIGRS